ncbi:DUF3566 domain-containing protein [Gordonia sp. CPCC 205333]|uniref:DUF3566 domain-containing protein n=1 Tax=Gordonia sp. CPCC 205333 TaxID=3140790 RepID=UPI003AF3E45A
MSTANEPDEQKTDGAGSSESTESPSTSGTRATVVPPWQRGQSESTAPGAQRAGQVDSAPGAQRAGQVDSAPGAKAPAGPPPRGVVSGTPGTDKRKPLNKLDAAGAKAGDGESGGAASETFVESPTRNIDRAGLATQNLPDLDAIHHVDAAKSGKAVPSSSSTRSGPTQVGAGRALRASVQIRRIDPWAMFKISAVLSIVGFFVWLISVAVLYLILDGMGVWDQVNSSFGTLTTADGSSGGGDIFGAGTIFGWAVGLGAINAILLTALATIGAFIYNLCADLVGGAEVTLADLD